MAESAVDALNQFESAVKRSMCDVAHRRLGARSAEMRRRGTPRWFRQDVYRDISMARRHNTAK